MKVPRLDLTFSYWIFAWYLMYMLGVVHVPPKLFLIIGLIINIFMLAQVKENFIMFIVIGIIATKLVPLITIYKTPIDYKEIYYGLGLLLMYIFWMKVVVKGDLFKIRTPMTDFIKMI